MWGLSTHIDLFGCDVAKITSQNEIENFANSLVELLDMEAYGYPVVEWFGNKETEGFTLIQLLTTSCITAHFSESYRKTAFIDIFSCKEYDQDKAVKFCANFFGASIYDSTEIVRGSGTIGLSKASSFPDRTL